MSFVEMSDSVSLCLEPPVLPDMTPAQEIPRPEYPQPQFKREQWMSLNGEWEFEFDDPNGLEENWACGARSSPETSWCPSLSKRKERHRRHDVPPWSGIGVAFTLARANGKASASCSISARWIIAHRYGSTASWRARTRAAMCRSTSISRPASAWRKLPSRCAPKIPHRPLHPPRQAVLGAEIARHLLHAHHRHLAVRVARGRGPTAISRRYASRLRSTARCASKRTSRARPDVGPRILGASFAARTRPGATSVGATARTTVSTVRLTDPQSAALVAATRPIFTTSCSSCAARQRGARPRATPTSVSAPSHGDKGRILLNGRPMYLKMVLDQGYWPESHSDAAHRTKPSNTTSA